MLLNSLLTLAAVFVAISPPTSVLALQLQDDHQAVAGGGIVSVKYTLPPGYVPSKDIAQIYADIEDSIDAKNAEYYKSIGETGDPFVYNVFANGNSSNKYNFAYELKSNTLGNYISAHGDAVFDKSASLCSKNPPHNSHLVFNGASTDSLQLSPAIPDSSDVGNISLSYSCAHSAYDSILSKKDISPNGENQCIASLKCSGGPRRECSSAIIAKYISNLKYPYNYRLNYLSKSCNSNFESPNLQNYIYGPIMVPYVNNMGDSGLPLVWNPSNLYKSFDVRYHLIDGVDNVKKAKKVISDFFSDERHNIGSESCVKDSDMDVCREYTEQVVAVLYNMFPDFIEYAHNGATVSETTLGSFHGVCLSNTGTINKCDLVDSFFTSSAHVYSGIYKFDSFSDLINSYNTDYNSDRSNNNHYSIPIPLAIDNDIETNDKLIKLSDRCSYLSDVMTCGNKCTSQMHKCGTPNNFSPEVLHKGLDSSSVSDSVSRGSSTGTCKNGFATGHREVNMSCKRKVNVPCKNNTHAVVYDASADYTYSTNTTTASVPTNRGKRIYITATTVVGVGLAAAGGYGFYRWRSASRKSMTLGRRNTSLA